MIWFLCFYLGASELELNLRAMADTYLVGDEEHRLEVAVKLSVETWRGETSLIVDRWIRGKVQRLFESPLSGLAPASESPKNLYLINGAFTGVFGSERAPISLRLNFDERNRRMHVFLYERGIEIYRLRYPGLSARSDYMRAVDFLSQGLDQVFRPVTLTSFMSGHYRPPTCSLHLSRGVSLKNPPRE